MRYEEERRQLIECVQELESTGVLEVGGGAASVRLPDGNVIVSPTGIPFRRWVLPASELVVMDPDGRVVERGGRLGSAPTPLFLALYRAFPEINSIIHGHSEWSLVFAAAGREIPAVTNAYDKLAPVPCVMCDDADLKARYLREPWPVPYPEAMLRRPDVAAVEAFVAAEATALFEPRRDDLARHSLAFTMYRHGIVVAGADLNRVAADLVLIEANARTAYRLGLAGTPPVPPPLRGAAVGREVEAFSGAGR
jgi:ribulose-5-phosphate 4-epimerase/fuculose-1-phosphate aldolase